jgi:hypothetical protein
MSHTLMVEVVGLSIKGGRKTRIPLYNSILKGYSYNDSHLSKISKMRTPRPRSDYKTSILISSHMGDVE